jgi:pyruvate/2-oxoacid:ferredoxin oxidoreductase alpha subunit
VDVPDQAAVDLFLPPYQAPFRLNVDDPKTYSIVCGSDLYSSIKYKRQADTLAVARLWDQVAERYNGNFNRLHKAVEEYRTEDADLCIAGIGTATGTIRLAVDRLREEGLKAGSLRLAMFRPFPLEGLLRAIGTAKHLIVIDRDISLGAEGIVAQEVKAALFEKRGGIKVTGFVAGIGGNDVTVDTIIPLVRQAISGEGNAVEAGMSLWAEVLP